MTKLPQESQNTEYKESWRDEYLKWICGFANAQGGRIYIGVDDDRQVVGISDSERLLEDIPNKIATHLGLVCDVNLLHADDLVYIEIIVSPSNIPIAYHGVYHYRSGSTKQELRGVALQQFVLKKMGLSWDNIPCDRATINDIDRSAIEYFLRRGIEAQRIPDTDKDATTEQVLINLGLMDDNGVLNNAAVLLFGKAPQRFFPSVQFKIGRFGKDEADLMYQDVVVGNILQMADKVMDLLQGKYLISPVRFEGMRRYETLEIPKEALREILYNAIAHKDYSGADIQMHVYDDHIDLWNEGELPEGYNQQVLMGRHSSKPRNRHIADTMFKAGFIDTWGRGFQKIQDGFQAAGLPMPTIQNFCGGVEVRIERTVFLATSDTPNVGNNVGDMSEVVGDNDPSNDPSSDPSSDPSNDHSNDPSSDPSKNSRSNVQNSRSNAQNSRSNDQNSRSNEENVGNDDPSNDHSKNSRSKKITKLIEYCQKPHSLIEIADYMNVRDKYWFKKHYIDPLLGTYLQMTEPNSPTSPTQKYVVITHTT